MSFIVLDDISVAMGLGTPETFSNNQAAQLQYYIDFVCTYIESECGVSFTQRTDAVRRYTADQWGRVCLVENNISVVTDIKDSSGNSLQFWTFDGVNQLESFWPWMVVDVTLTYGLTEVPLDIKGVAIEAVKRAGGTGKSGQAVNSHQVGDVRDTYSGGLDSALAFTKTEKDILERYGVSEETWYTSPKPSRRQRRTIDTFDPFWDGWGR